MGNKNQDNVPSICFFLVILFFRKNLAIRRGDHQFSGFQVVEIPLLTSIPSGWVAGMELPTIKGVSPKGETLEPPFPKVESPKDVDVAGWDEGCTRWAKS